MSNIAKHDSEQEREGDNSKESRVDLLVRRDTVTVHDSLESFRKLVRAQESGRRLVCA